MPNNNKKLSIEKMTRIAICMGDAGVTTAEVCEMLRKISNKVNHPNHYNQHPSGVECIDIVEEMCFNIGNSVKYVWREGLKDVTAADEDIEKAIWYLQRELERRKKRNPTKKDEAQIEY